MNTLAILLVLSTAAGSANTKRIARAQAQRMADAFVQGDFGTVADFTHPRLVQGMGGRERMIEVLRRGTELLKEQGSAFAGAELGEPLRMVRVGKDFQCVLPQELRTRVAGGVLWSMSSVIGFSSDGGSAWRFVDASNPTARTSRSSS